MLSKEAPRWIALLGAGAAVAVVGLVLATRDASFNPRHVHVYQTAPGQYASVQLAGRATLALAPATTVLMTPDTMTVSGEVYVRVLPHVAQPLVIRTANATVRVLGTTFTVRHYPTDHTTRVAVLDGKVEMRARASLATPARHMILTANMIGQASDSGIAVTTETMVGDYAGFMRGRLSFEQVPLGDVIVELARAYNAEIHLADTALAHQPITMTAVVHDESLTHVLDLLTQAIEARYTRRDSAFVISAGRSSMSVPRPFPHWNPPPPETSYGR